ncbi:MAG: hypothetical protein L3J96_06450, partial [Thermoplasmata archaeon]|nr:hypothetical protein [Thermoplasmata archaeon]
MSKRRFRNENEEKSVQELSASERRAQRKKERAQGGGVSRSAKGLGSPWRRGVVVGVPVVAIIAV